MRVLYVIPTLEKGGAERLVQDICIALQKRPGIKVKLCVLRRTGNQAEDEPTGIDWELASSYVHPSITRKSKIDVSAFVQIVKKFKPDVIHSHLFEAELVSRYYLFDNVKYFTHCHDNMKQLQKLSFQTLLSKAKLAEFYERSILVKKYEQCNNQFIAISKDNLRYFQENLPPSLANNIHLLHNAFDFKRFNRSLVRRDFSAGLQLLNVASFKPKKNQQFLVDVVKELKDRNIPVSLKLIGLGHEHENVKKKVSDYGLTKEIVFVGNVHNVEDYLEKANIYVHAAYAEAFGLVYLEAMAAGLPVVTLDGKGNRDLIRDGENGYFIGEHNPHIFADKIIEVMSNEDRYRLMSNNAVNFARKFDVENYAARLLELYQQ